MSAPLEVLTISVERYVKILSRLCEGVEKPCTDLQAMLWSNCIWVSELGLWLRVPFHDRVLEGDGEW